MDERPSWERESERASRLSAGSDDRELAAQRGCLNWLYLLSPLRSPADLQELFTDPQGFLLRWIIWLLILALGLWWIIRWLIGLLA